MASRSPVSGSGVDAGQVGNGMVPWGDDRGGRRILSGGLDLSLGRAATSGEQW